MNRRAFLLFSIDGQLYAVDVHAVRQVIQAVELTPVHNGPELLFGLLNMHGDIIPVLDIRRQLGRPLRQLRATDRMVIARTNGHIITFAADDIETIIEWESDDITPSAGMFPGMEHIIVGTASHRGLTILVYATDQLFPDHEVDRVVKHLNDNHTMSC